MPSLLHLPAPIVACALLAVCASFACSSGGSFDKEAWQDWECCRDLTRADMVDDLSERLIGLTRDEVIDMLGPPEVADMSNFYGCGNCLIYRLGLERGIIRIDPDHLIVRLNQDDIVVGVQVN